jgi:hypothetical protein
LQLETSTWGPHKETCLLAVMFQPKNIGNEVTSRTDGQDNHGESLWFLGPQNGQEHPWRFSQTCKEASSPSSTLLRHHHTGQGGEAVAHLVSPSKWPAQGGNQEHGGWVSETWRRVRRLCWISLALGAYCMLMLAGELKTSRPQGSLSFDSTTLSSCRTNNQGVRRKRLVQRFTLLQEQRRW